MSPDSIVASQLEEREAGRRTREGEGLPLPLPLPLREEILAFERRKP